LRFKAKLAHMGQFCFVFSVLLYILRSIVKALTALKHMFIPHEHNDYKPHFFREISMVIILCFVIFLLGMSFGSSYFLNRTVLGANVTASVLIDLTNESRLAYNEQPLVRSALLDQAAQMKAQDMTNEGYFAHTSPEGVTPWHWFQEVGYTFLYAGENLAINFTDAQAVRDAWLASPKHRQNLLDIKFQEIGMATMDGLYKGDPSIYVVQLFGTPAVIRKAQSVAVATTSVATSTNLVKSPELAQVKGESAASTPYEEVVATQEVAIVKNPEAEALTSAPATAPAYSTWYDKLLVGVPYYVQAMYIVLFLIVVFALATMVVVEVHKQHWKHIAYGFGLLVFILLALISTLAL
jgi:hypothetical protein